MNGLPRNEPTVTQRDLEQVNTDLQNSFDFLLSNIQQVFSAAVAEQIKALTSHS